MIRTFALIAGIMLNLTSVLNAQKEVPPKSGPAKDFRLPAKSVKTLGNGLRTTMVQYGSVPKVRISLLIATGQMHETPQENGLSGLTVAMMKQGSAGMDYKALSAKVAAMGGELEIYSSRESTTVTAAVLAEFAPDLVEILAAVVMKPNFPAADLERLKQDLKRQLSLDKTIPQSIAGDTYSRAIFGNHPFGRGFTTEAMIDGFTQQKVRDFYSKNFGATRSSLYIVGTYDSLKVQQAVAKSFGSWKSGPQRFTPPVTVKANPDTIIIDRKGAPQTTVMLGLATITPNNKDYMGLVVADALLGSSFGSRITRNIREDKGYTYSPYSDLLARKGISVWTEQADITSENTLDALKEIEKEIGLLQQTMPSEDELKGIKNYLNGIFVLYNSSPEGIISQLSFLEKHQLPESFLTDYVKNVNSITPKQVSEIVKKHLDLSKMTVIMVGDKEQIQKQVESRQPKKAF